MTISSLSWQSPYLECQSLYIETGARITQAPMESECHTDPSPIPTTITDVHENSLKQF